MTDYYTPEGHYLGDNYASELYAAIRESQGA